MSKPISQAIEEVKLPVEQEIVPVVEPSVEEVVVAVEKTPDDTSKFIPLKKENKTTHVF
jgi:hypothetical protein